MNRKDYKVIAKIIKINITQDWVNLSLSEEKVLIECEKKLRERYAKRLADYFEKEDKENGFKNRFRKRIFLLNCGVEE